MLSPLDIMKQNCEYCPICGASSSSFKELDRDNVECFNCRSQRHFNFESGEAMVSLVKAGRDEYSHLLGREKPVDFWEDMGRAAKGTAKWGPVLIVSSQVAGILFTASMIADSFTIQTWRGSTLEEATRPYSGYFYPLLMLSILALADGIIGTIIAAALGRQARTPNIC